jgi:hypothetical protein
MDADSADASPITSSSLPDTSPPDGSHDTPSTESASPDRWQRLGNRSLVLWRGTVEFWRRTVELWRRMVKALQEAEPDHPWTSQASSPPGGRTERRDAPAPIRVSARGHVYDFNVHASFTWSSDGLRQDALSSYAHYYMPDVVLRLSHVAAERAGNFAPHDAANLEADLQRKLSEPECPWRYDRGDVVVECQPHVRVGLDERVRQLVMPYLEQRIKLDCELDVAMRRADHFERLSLQWLTILKKPADGSVAGGAGQTTNEDLAGAVQRMVAEHKAAVQRLKDLLDETLRNSDIVKRATTLDAPHSGQPDQGSTRSTV